MGIFLKKWYKQKNAQDHIPAVVVNLLRYLHIPATHSKIQEILKTHPDYPSLLAIAESLRDWGIQAEAVQGTVADLSNIDYPGIAHLKTDRFVILEKITNGWVHYLDPAKGPASSPLKSFDNIWSGVILRVSQRLETGENNFRANRRDENFKKFRNLLTIPGFALLGILALANGLNKIGNVGNAFPILWGVKLLGLILCLGMVLSSVFDSDIIKKVCSIGKKGNCLKVLNSPAGKILGISMAEMGMFYFLGGLLTLTFTLYTGQTELNLFLLAAINVTTLPYTFFSIIYQALVIRSWCWMCVIVQISFWIEFYFLSDSIQGGIHGFEWGFPLAIVMGFSIPIISWVGLRPLLMKANHASQLEWELIRHRRNPDYIRMQLVNAEKIDMGNFSDEVYVGPKNAPIILTLVVNPLCSSCWNIFRELDQLVRFGNRNIKGCIRFLVWSGNSDKTSRENLFDSEVSVLMLSIAQDGNKDGVKNALRDWFSSSKEFTRKKFEKWRKKYSSLDQGDRKKAEVSLRYHNAWAKSVSILETPTILLNGLKLPPAILLEDLKYFLLRQIEEYEESGNQGRRDGA